MDFKVDTHKLDLVMQDFYNATGINMNFVADYIREMPPNQRNANAGLLCRAC